MKILAIIDAAPDAKMENIRAGLTSELKGSWALFTAGVIREAYATSAPTRVVFIIEASDVAQAAGHLQTLPLVAAGLVRVELMELRPFQNWSLLFAK